jgi:hypothetical protein
MFENELLPPTAVQQRQRVDAVGCSMFFSGLISMFVFDILHIPSRWIQICSGRTAVGLAIDQTKNSRDVCLLDLIKNDSHVVCGKTILLHFGYVTDQTLKSDQKHDCNSSLEINHGIKFEVFRVQAMNEYAEYRNVKTQMSRHSKLQQCQIKRIFYSHKLILRVLIFSF